MLDTIAAIATPMGRAGVGVIRISGTYATEIAKKICGKIPPPRLASLRNFRSLAGEVLDKGLLLFFPHPYSFTGEDVIELHTHGSPVVLHLLLQTVLQAGAKMARPGEFSQRAFLNGKLDLAQAEAVADLIDASTKEAAFAAVRSLQGAFSQQIIKLSEAMLACRLYVEAAIDFPEEEIDFLSEGSIKSKIENLAHQVKELLARAQQGQLLKEGLQVAIVGQPNVGKSSLLNCLTQQETAIVTPIAGTTRDLIKETIQIDGLPVHLIDTAGIRENAEQIEQQGIIRAQAQQKIADRILLVVDATLPELHATEQAILEEYPQKVILVFNKIDLCSRSLPPGALGVSAKFGHGIPELLKYLKKIVGFQEQEASIFIARSRHLTALRQAQQHLQAAYHQLIHFKAGECVAHELSLAHSALGEIVGKTTPEDLLGQIFSNFCIGK